MCRGSGQVQYQVKDYTLRSGEKATAERVADAIVDNRAELVHLPSTIDLNSPLPSKDCPTCDGTGVMGCPECKHKLQVTISADDIMEPPWKAYNVLRKMDYPYEHIVHSMKDPSIAAFWLMTLPQVVGGFDYDDDIKQKIWWQYKVPDSFCFLTLVHEAVLVQQIVSDIYEKLNYLSLVKEKELVGIKKHIEKIESLLSMGSKDVFTVGIWGLVSVGKSTVASVVYRRIYEQFDRYCFIDNVKEQAERSDGLSTLKQEILSAITLEDKNDDRSDAKQKSAGSKKVLMVFDNVTQGSRIIIITRDEQVLKECRVDKTHKVEGLLHAEALILFNSYAFKDHDPGERSLELSNKVIIYARGAPFLIKILGSFLYGKRPQDWESTLNMLERNGGVNFLEVLKICYNGLSDEAKKIFEDIASFFNGMDIDRIKSTLEAKNNFSMEMGLNVLLSKHFISIANNKVKVHDLLQKMGREIVWSESCQRSLLSMQPFVAS
ncbi:TMV resistance protein N-like [Pistacia vera]|uniref:TMV resistance protein N-like n=1 Tax=Pistacia vera TaxID=55513 RepID=UPI0012635A25|nr:TMV resistance protein N-like [Pistacia vera]